MTTALDAEWARTAFDNPRALLPQRPRPKSPPAISETVLASMSKPRPTASKVGAGGTATATTYRLLSPDDLLSTPLMRDLVKGILPRNGTAAIVGASMAGKGFIVFNLMAILAEGGIWFGCRVDMVPVVYVGLEGAGGLPKRIRAWEKHNGRKYPEIRIITQSLDLRNAVQVDAFIEAIRAAGFADGVVFIDTLNQAAGGADENSSRDMGELIAALKHIQESLGGLVVVVHHLGKDITRGPRGHSSFLAGLDASIEVRREGNRREWVVGKAKDDEDGAVFPFRLQVVDIGEDDDGDPITSCVVVPEDSAADAIRRTLPPKSGNQRIIWDAIGELLRDSKSFGKAGAPVSRPCVEIETAVDLLRTRLACEPKRQTERARSAISGLVERGLLILREGWLWAA